MKILPCREGCNGAPAQLTKDGKVQCVGRLSSPVFAYKCRKCGKVNRITSTEFNRLPRMTDDEIRDLTDISLPAAPKELPHPTRR